MKEPSTLTLALAAQRALALLDALREEIGAKYLVAKDVEAFALEIVLEWLDMSYEAVEGEVKDVTADLRNPSTSTQIH